MHMVHQGPPVHTSSSPHAVCLMPIVLPLLLPTAGKTFVISGVLDSLYRNEAEDLIKAHGGRVTSAVSGKTTFLLAGQNSGRSKWNEVRGAGRRWWVAWVPARQLAACVLRCWSGCWLRPGDPTKHRELQHAPEEPGAASVQCIHAGGCTCCSCSLAWPGLA